MPEPLAYANPALSREIGLGGAVMLGLGSILGTGVFVGLAHATALAGPWVLLAIVLAGLLAFCNAMSSAQLAAAHPVAGGTYEYGYRLLTPTWGFVAGWMFLLAKSASAATAALGLAHVLRYVTFNSSPVTADRAYSTTVAIAAVAAVTVTGMSGISRAAKVNFFIVLVVMVGLCAFVIKMSPQIGEMGSIAAKPTSPFPTSDILNSVALCFVAFTGYGRLATLGEEVLEPRRTIPSAIVAALVITVAIYLGVAAVMLPFEPWITRPESIIGFVWVRGRSPFGWVVAIAAFTAMLGVLLNLILGLSRVWLAMGRRRDMPRVLAQVSERTGTPVPATILSGIVIALLVLVGDVRLTWSFSAFAVLIYYAITNLAALRLPPEDRLYPRALAWIGLFACLGLAWFVEVKVWVAGSVLIVIGLIWHRLRSGHRMLSVSPT